MNLRSNRNDKNNSSNSDNNFTNSGHNSSDSTPSSPKMKWKKRHTRGRNAQHNNTAKSTMMSDTADTHSADNKHINNRINMNMNMNMNMNIDVKKPFPMNIEALKSVVNLPAGWEAQIKFANEQRQRLDQLQQRLNSAKTDPNAVTAAANSTACTSTKQRRQYGPAPPPNLNSNPDPNGANGANNVMGDATSFPLEPFNDMDVYSMLQTELMDHCMHSMNCNDQDCTGTSAISEDDNNNYDNNDCNISENGKKISPDARDMFLQFAAAQAYANQSISANPKGQDEYVASPSVNNHSSSNISSDEISAKEKKRSGNATSTFNDKADSTSNSKSTAEGMDAPANDTEMKALMNMFFEIMGMSYDPNGNQQNCGPESVFAAMEHCKRAGDGSANVDLGNFVDAMQEVGVTTWPGGGANGPDLQAASAFMKENLARLSNAANAKNRSNANVSSKGNRNKTSGKNDNVSGGNTPNATSNVKTSKNDKQAGGGTITFQTSMSSSPSLPPNQFFSMMVRGGSEAISSFKMCKPPAAAKLAKNLIPPPPGGWPPGTAAAAAAVMASANSPAPWESPYEFVDGTQNEDDLNDSTAEDLDDYDEDCSIPDLMPMNESSLSPKISEHWNGARKMAESNRLSSENRGDTQKSEEPDISTLAAAQLLREEEDAAAARDEDEEKAKRAAKKREKKQRKKEKSRREAAIKAAEASIKKREKSIISWQSRMVTAFTGGEVKKVDSLILENPFKEGKRPQLDPDTYEYLDQKVLSHSDEVNESMEWLLNSCVVKNTVNGKSTAWLEARNKLCMFIADMAYHIVFEPKGESKSALHRACFTGDLTFVKIVIDHEKSPKDYLAHSCEDLGWNALHYAAVGGQSDVVELLLRRGCGTGPCTNPSITCRAENRKGLTAKGLIETIAANTYSAAVESSGDGFRELVDGRLSGSAAENQEYLETINVLIDRLNFVEKEGYTSLNAVQEVGDDVESVCLEETSHSATSIEQSKPKRKKKKKKDAQQPDAAPPAQVKKGVSDPLVSTLVSMGFSAEQIDSAVLAFGGTDIVTADDMVIWILEKESDDGISGMTSGVSNPSTEIHQQMCDTQQMQRMAEQHAKEAAEEADIKAAEAKSAIERLRAKREEQRRIRREWNNREQLRQQEEAKSKLTEEVFRRKQIEFEKAKAAAQMAADERAAPSVLSQHMGISTLESFGAITGQPSAGSIPLFATGFANGLAIDQTVANSQFLDQSLVLESTPPPGIPLPGTSGNVMDTSATKSFKSNRKNKKSRSQKHEISPNRGRKQTNVERSMANGPPHVPVSQSMYDEPIPVSYDSNFLGEIRATAREFVPSFSPGPTAIRQSSNQLLPPAPPGLNERLSVAAIETEAQLSSGLASQSIASTDVLGSASSIVSGYSDSASSSPFPMPSIDREILDSRSSGILPPSPGQSAGGSLTSLPTATSNFMPRMLDRNSGNNTINNEDDFDTSLLNLELDSHPPSSRGNLGSLPLDARNPSVSLSGSGIWGGPTPSSGNIGRLSSFGFAQGDNTNTSFSSHDAESNAGESKQSTSNWGSFGPSPGGSIW